MTDTAQLALPPFFVLLCEVFETFVVRKESDCVFSPKPISRILYFVFISVCLTALIGEVLSRSGSSHGVKWWYLILFLIFLMIRPRTLVADPAGLASYSLYGMRRIFIPWADISRVSSDWHEEHSRLWTSMGYNVAVTDRFGRRIEHGIHNQDQGRFLDVLRKHVPAARFDAGLYDWHP